MLHRRTLRLASLPCLLLLAAPACDRAAARAERPGGRPPPPVYVAPARTETVLYRIRTVGQLEPDEAVRVRSEIKGLVTEVLVNDGDRVADKQVLFRLEDIRARASLAEAAARVLEIRATLIKAADDLAQDRALFERGIVDEKQTRASQSAYDALQAGLTAAKARVLQLREDVADTVIRAPFAGEVSERLAYAGDYVEDGDALVEVFRTKPLKLRFSVPERRVGSVPPGARVDFIVPGFGDEVFHGTITYIAPVADEASRNISVKAIVPNADRRLRPGLFIKLQVITDERPHAVVVPEGAIVLEGTTASAYILTDDTVERRTVELGIRTDDAQREVLRGITAGEMVVVRGQHGLPDGAKVRVIEPRGTDAG